MYADPGHGWLAVPKAVIAQLGIGEKISEYSYERGTMALLEEDRDAGVLITALKAAGKTVEIVNHHTDRRSKIRGYNPFKAIA